MEKNYLKKSTTLVSLVCVIAILASLACQYLSGWEFTGLMKDLKTGEERAVALETSLASYIWNPTEPESLAFEEYLKNPGLTYTEELIQKNCNEEEATTLDKMLNPPKAKNNQFVNEVPTFVTPGTTTTPEATEEVAPVEPATEEVAPVEPATEEVAPVEPATEEVAPVEPATEEEVPAKEAAPAEEETTFEYDSSATYSGLMVKLAQVPKDPYSTKKTVLETINSESANKRYEEFALEINKDHSKFINGTVSFPVLLFFASIIAILAIFFALFKDIKNFVASGVTVLIGLLNILHLFVQPLYLVCQYKSFVLMLGISAVVTLWGLILLLIDVKSVKKAKAEAK